MSLPPVVQEFSINAAAYLAGIDEMLAATDKLAESLDAVSASAAAMSESVARVSAAADVGMAAVTASSEQATQATEALTEAERAAADAAKFEADLLADLDASQKLLADSAKAVTDGLATEARAMKIVADSAAQAGTAVATMGDESVVAGGKAAESGDTATAAGGKWKTAFLGIAIAAGYGIEQASKFQGNMAQLHTQAGVAQDKIAGLSQGVLQLAGQVGEGPESLSESLYHVASNLASLGVSGPSMLSAVKVAAEGAQIGGADLVDVTNALGAAIASGIPGVQNYSQAMGYMNATVGAGDMHMQDLADAFGTGVLANIKQYGVSLRDVSAALATYGDNNIRGAKAGTDLRMAVQSLAVQGPSAAKELAALGLSTNSLGDALKNGGLNPALQLLISHMKAAGVTAKDQGQVITELFGKRAGSGIGVLVGEFDRFQSKYKDVQKGADAFAGDWTARTKTMAQQWNDLKSGAQALAISFGTVLLPAATKIVSVLGKFANALEQHPALAAFAGAMLAVAVAFKVAAAAEALFDAVTDANPIMLAVLAVIALAAGLYELYKHSQLVRAVVADIGKFFKSAWQDAMKAAGAVIAWFTGGPLKSIKSEIGVFTKWWAANSAEIKQVWNGVWTVIKTVAVTYWKILSTEIKTGLVILKAVWIVAWVVIRDTVVMAWNVIAAIVKTTINIILDVISVVLDVITGHWSKAWNDLKKLVSDALHGAASIIVAVTSGWGHLLFDAGKAIIEGLINGVKAMFGAVKGVIGDVAHGITGAFKGALSIFSPSRVFYDLGANITQGLAMGINETASQAYAAAKKLASQVTAAYGSGQVTGTQESQLLDRIQSDLAARKLSLDKVAASIDYAKAGAQITAKLGASIVETMPQAQAAAKKLMAGVEEELSKGQLSSAQAGQLQVRISEALTARQDKLVKTMQQIGLKMKAGLLDALADAGTASAVKTAVNKLVSYVQQAWSVGDISTRSATSLTAFLERDNTRLQALATQRQTLAATIKTADDYAASTTSSAQDFASLSNVAGAMTSGGVMYSGNLLAGLQADLKSVNQFTAAIKKLGQLGLNKNLLNQIIQMGPEQGLQVANSLIDGPLSVLKSMNTAEAGILAGTDSLGKTAANLMYDSGAQAGKGFLSGLQAQQKSITKMMDTIADSMVDTIKKDLKIHSPSLVMDEHGQMVAMGLVQGMERGVPGVQGAAKKLAGATLLPQDGAGAGGGYGAGGGVTYHYHFTVQGFIGSGSEREVGQQLFKLVQPEILDHKRRNGGNNGLS